MEQETVVINGKTYKQDQIYRYDVAAIKEKNIYDDYRNANYKNFYFEFEELPDKKVVLFQNHRLNKGGIFWDGSYLLLKYFLQTETSWQDNKDATSSIKILELGAGTALPSIVAGLLGYQATATDLPFMIPFIEQNIYENIEKGKNVEVKQLEWGNEEHMNEISGKFNYIFAAELVYVEDHFDALVKTLKHYSDEKTKIIMTYKVRLPERSQLFLSKYEKEFDIEYVDQSTIKKFLPNPNMYVLVAKLKAA